MRLKLGIFIALLFMVWGCGSSPSSQDQLRRLEELQASPKTTIAPSPNQMPTASPSPSSNPLAEPSSSPSVAPEPAVSPSPEGQESSDKIPMFRNCKEAKANGYSNIDVSKHPEYASKDRDKDGIACES